MPHWAYSTKVHAGSGQGQAYLPTECLCCEVPLTELIRSESGGPVHIGVVLCILLIAHCGICNFLVALMQVLLLVNHVPSPSAVHALP